MDPSFCPYSETLQNRYLRSPKYVHDRRVRTAAHVFSHTQAQNHLNPPTRLCTADSAQPHHTFFLEVQGHHYGVPLHSLMRTCAVGRSTFAKQPPERPRKLSIRTTWKLPPPWACASPETSTLHTLSGQTNEVIQILPKQPQPSFLLYYSTGHHSNGHGGCNYTPIPLPPGPQH